MNRHLMIFAAAAAAAMTACGGGEKPAQTAVSSAAPVAVKAQTAAARDWPESYEATGTVRARVPAVISSKLMAYVQQVSVQAGDHVREGQLLVTMDARDLESAVQRAEAARAEVQSAIPEADNGMAAAKAALDLAQTTHNRIQDLASKKSVSTQELDESSARLKGAQASYEMARARRAQLDSKVAQVEQEIRSAHIMRDYARISAPFAGVVTARSVEPGSLAVPGAPLLTIEREGDYRLEASVDESRLPLAKAGQAVEVSLDSLDRRFPARVSEVVPTVDAASRTYIAKIDLPAAAGVRSGMFGRAIFAAGSRKVTAIPAAALVERGQLQTVFVIDNGVAHTRLVTTGRRSGDSIEVLSGLNEGENIVTPVPATLADGARVEVR
ncbi:MAG: efflux RND transporter periplasmic adaptor subunit [Acidobacteriota bacterium]|nr:efflux RND transporter periplasmic adaptor subunit [Acidobacteriota bacterium]